LKNRKNKREEKQNSSLKGHEDLCRTLIILFSPDLDDYFFFLDIFRYILRNRDEARKKN
jgi:hypothetical protein